MPSSRPASALSGLIQLTADIGCVLVVLCSLHSKVDQVAERIGRVTGARGLAVQIDEKQAVGDLVFETSDATFFLPSGGRNSDLSLKRNLGLLLARLQGWRKIVFLDDDITISAHDLGRLADQLRHQQIAGMVSRKFPDNSVFCHARRLAKLWQDVFVTGAALGVNCSDIPLPFFPDVYNEDWFFFAEAAAANRLAKVGEARQAEYSPFAEPTRASDEEFGDLLAEGLYSLIENKGAHDSLAQTVRLANAQYWTSFIEVRRQDLAAVRARLDEFTWREHCSDDVYDAVRSLEVAEGRYDDRTITAGHCVDFLDAWRSDTEKWNRLYQGTSSLCNIGQAMEQLRVGVWEQIR